MYKKYPKIAFLNPTKPPCKSSFHKTVTTEILFQKKPSIRISCINRKCTGTNKAIILGAHMFNKKNYSKNHDQVIPYIKPPVTMELKKRVNFFGTTMKAFSEAKS